MSNQEYIIQVELPAEYVKETGGHIHAIGDVVGLHAALDSKQPEGDYAVQSDIDSAVAAEAAARAAADDALQNAIDSKQPTGSYATEAELVTETTSRANADADLQAAIDAEATTRANADADLQTALDGKANAIHSHAVSDVTGLQSALDGKQIAGDYAPATHGHAIGDVSGLQTALDGKQPSGSYATTGALSSEASARAAADAALQSAIDGKQPAGDYATLDGGGKVPASQLPSYVDDVLEYASLAGFPSTGESGKIYIAVDTNKTYRWSGSGYVEISASPGSTDAVPEGSVNLYHTTARAAAAAPVQSVAGKTGAVALVKGDVGLSNVDNTSDASKPVSTAQAAADAAVQSAAASDATTKANAAQAYAIQRANHTGTQSADTLTDGTTNKAFLATERTKLAGIATGATANSSDATLLARANHTGTQTASTISDFASTVLATVLTGLSTATNAVITATDSVLSALGKLQKQVSDNLSTLTGHTSNTSNPHSTTAAQVGAEPTQTAMSQAEAEAGTSTATRSVTPQRIGQAITALAVNFLRGAANTWTGIQTFATSVIFNGTSITAPNQTAASGSSLMTRDLVSSYYPSLTQYAQPTSRCLGPMVAYGAMSTGQQLVSYYLYLVPIFCGSSRSITTAFVEVTTAGPAGITLELAGFATRSATDPYPGVRIANSFASVDASTTGVKTITFSPSWTAPKGLFYMALKSKYPSSSNTVYVRAFDGSGRDNALAASLLHGYDPTSPTAQFRLGGQIFVQLGDNASIPSDCSSSFIEHDGDGNPSYGIFVR